MTDGNPYAAPKSDLGDGRSRETQRPLTPKVLGILGIIFGVLGIISAPFAFSVMESQADLYAQIGYSMGYMMFSQALGLVLSLGLLIAAIGLLKYREWGRTTFSIYAVISIVVGVVAGVYGIINLSGADFANQAERTGAVAGAYGGLAGLLFPVLGLIFLNRKHVKASLGRKPHVNLT